MVRPQRLEEDHSRLEASLRDLVAPVIEFLERAKQVDGGWPDRYKGDRLTKFDPSDFEMDFAYANPMKRVGFTLDAHIEFSPHDEHGHGPALELGVWVRDHSYNSNSASMSIRIHGDQTVLYRGACGNLDNAPPREPIPLTKDKCHSYGIYRMMALITETYYYYSFEAGRTAELNKLAAEIHNKHYGDPDMKQARIASIPRLEQS